ncbi:hypothetical protein J6590_008136 [Homalodisca vitripennis]|nr:hypothetical protein J6590_008136 [Homalodisca vitripennis]
MGWGRGNAVQNYYVKSLIEVDANAGNIKRFVTASYLKSSKTSRTGRNSGKELNRRSWRHQSRSRWKVHGDPSQVVERSLDRSGFAEEFVSGLNGQLVVLSFVIKVWGKQVDDSANNERGFIINHCLEKFYILD